MKKLIYSILMVLGAIYLFGYWGVWKTGCVRTYCDDGESLCIKKKTGDDVNANQYSDPNKNQKGVMENMLGPGTYWKYDPIEYDTERVKDFRLLPPEIAIVKNKIGKEVKKYIVGEGEIGIQQQVLTAGTWKINPFGKEIVEKRRAIYIPAGYVGVQTIKVGENQGVSKMVLQAGYYDYNPLERQITRMPIGYWEWISKTEVEEIEVQGKKMKKPKEGTGISFPLADGKRMYLDLSVIWTTVPENCPSNLESIGIIEDIQKKVIEPQVNACCQNEGRHLTTLDFIQGIHREEFQRRVDESMREICAEKKVNVSIVLVRDFYPDPVIKSTIQAAKLAEEEKKTLEKEMVRDSIAANLEKSKRTVATRVSDFDAETAAIVAEEKQRGEKLAAETKAKADQKVADIEKQAALIQAEIIKIQGQADADVIEAKKKADASKLQFEIQASGGAEQYNRIILADSLLEGLNVKFIYSGEGTFWTSLDSNLNDLAAKKVLEQGSKPKKKE